MYNDGNPVWFLVLCGVVLGCILAPVQCSSENVELPDPVWEKTYGGTREDGAYAVVQGTEGGYLIAGFTTSFGAGGRDVYLVKVLHVRCAVLVWEKAYGGTGFDYADDIVSCSDGGYLIVGDTTSFGAGLYDIYLIKVDQNGSKLWEKTYGGTREDGAAAVVQCSDGGYLIAGDTASFGAGGRDVYLVKVLHVRCAVLVWEKAYGGTGFDYADDIVSCSDGGYLIVGDTTSFGAGFYDIYLMKVDQNGSKLWEKTYGGTDSDVGHAVQCSDGGYLIAGQTSWGSYADVYLVRVDQNGSKLWQQTVLSGSPGSPSWSIGG